MGKRGPPPKPTALKKRDGTYRKDRAPKNEMVAPSEAPPRPTGLDAEARAEWDRIVPQLLELGVLARIDQAMLAHYCNAHSLAVKATRQYQREGLVLKTPFGPQKNPMIKVAQDARAQALALAREFGLSPSSRTRVAKSDAPKVPASNGVPLVGPGLTVVEGGKRG